jgi:hypothetical protein
MQSLLEQEQIALTGDQEAALDVFYRFYLDPNPDCVFVLRGAAGTGKTFLIRLLSRFMARQSYKTSLLAPTGRAAKVITRRAKRYASTLHRYIYTPIETGGGSVHFQLKENKDAQKMCYIVDEASMVGDGGEGGGASLLADFFVFAFSESTQRKVILVGDPAQLPPVGSQLSPALDREYLKEHFHMTVYQTDMKEVMRQESNSEILVWAAEVRASMEELRTPVLERTLGAMSRWWTMAMMPWNSLPASIGRTTPTASSS